MASINLDSYVRFPKKLHPSSKPLTTPLLPYRIASLCKYSDHLIFPDCIIGLLMIFDAAVPDTGQVCIIRTEGPDKLDPPDPASTVIQDQQSPAAIVPADLRPCQVYRTKGFSASGLESEKRAGIGQFIEYTLI